LNQKTPQIYNFLRLAWKKMKEKHVTAVVETRLIVPLQAQKPRFEKIFLQTLLHISKKYYLCDLKF